MAKYVCKNENTAGRIIDGQAVIITLHDNTLHTLNEIGSRIWELCSDQRELDDIFRTIHEEYAVDYEKARADGEAFIRELCTKGIVSLYDERAECIVED